MTPPTLPGGSAKPGCPMEGPPAFDPETKAQKQHPKASSPFPSRLLLLSAADINDDLTASYLSQFTRGPNGSQVDRETLSVSHRGRKDQATCLLAQSRDVMLTPLGEAGEIPSAVSLSPGPLIKPFWCTVRRGEEEETFPAVCDSSRLICCGQEPASGLCTPSARFTFPSPSLSIQCKSNCGLLLSK